MNTKLSFLALAVMLSGQICPAQTNEPADDWKPATSNQQGKQYPQVNSEGCVRARLVAPQAQSVALDLGDVKYPLTKGDDGAWIGVSKPQDEGFHYYQLVIDGAQVPDPNSLFFYGASRWGSGIEIPAKDQDFYALKNVPHGQLREVHYFPNTSNGGREVTGGRGMGANGKANAEALKEAGVNSHYYESPLTAHEWQSWRRGLYQFAPLLFQD